MVQDKKKTDKRKEMKIVLKSKPTGSTSVMSTQAPQHPNQKPQSFKKKGTRGPSWIG